LSSRRTSRNEARDQGSKGGGNISNIEIVIVPERKLVPNLLKNSASGLNILQRRSPYVAGESVFMSLRFVILFFILVHRFIVTNYPLLQTSIIPTILTLITLLDLVVLPKKGTTIDKMVSRTSCGSRRMDYERRPHGSLTGRLGRNLLCI
jgi:hypothetical protein